MAGKDNFKARGAADSAPETQTAAKNAATKTPQPDAEKASLIRGYQKMAQLNLQVSQDFFSCEDEIAKKHN